MMDVNKPVTNPELVRAISEMGENSKEKQDQVINEIMKAHFISPVIISPTPQPSININEAVIKKNTTISLVLLKIPQIKNFS